ncbi:MAG: tRNA lysidine(34) synthetase TilS [Rickettsiales bacterium]
MAINSKLIDAHLPSNCKKIAVALSGGADSTYLALAAQAWAKPHKAALTGLIVDHGLRKESGAEAEYVAAKFNEIGIPCAILKWEGKKPKSNIQEMARIERYRLLVEYCLKNKIKHLLVAHNKNDQAETVLLRILRGTGVDGLAAMRKLDIRSGVHIVRPLLNVDRKQIESELKAKKITWVDDPSNLNEKFDRIKLRNLINKQDDPDQWISRLSLLAKNAARTRDFIEQEVKKAEKKVCKYFDLNYLTMDFDKFNKLHMELQLRVLRNALVKISSVGNSIRLDSLEELLSSLPVLKGKTLHGCVVIKKGNRIIIFRELASLKGHDLLGRGYLKIIKHLPPVPDRRIYMVLPADYK